VSSGSAVYTVLANSVLFAHATFVVFVVLGVPIVVLGGYMNWQWVRLRWLRILHLAGIGIVAAQAWLGVICPLTTLELWLRQKAGLATYSGSFIEHWLHELVYWNLPSWVFLAAYSLFAILVVCTWYLVPPVRSTHRGDTSN